MALPINRGIVDRPSNHSVEQTEERLKDILRSLGVTLFAVIDHSGEAAKVGLKMKPTKLLIFGNPKAGTPVMLSVPRSALDLPLKILIWEDVGGKVWLSYNSPKYLQDRHDLPPELLQKSPWSKNWRRELRNNLGWRQFPSSRLVLLCVRRRR